MPDVVLIGPSGTGKTTLARLVGEALGRPSIDLDEVRWTYYDEIGYDRARAEELQREDGTAAMITYWKPFEIHSVERLLADHPHDHVLAFGAGQSVYDDRDHDARVHAALAPHLVLLLLPSPDLEVSLTALTERVRANLPDLPAAVIADIEAMNRGFLEHPANHALADRVVHTLGRTPEQTRDEIVELVRSQIGGDPAGQTRPDHDQ